MYWEPTKMTAKLRSLKTDSNVVILYTLNSGHMGDSGDDYYQDLAFQYSFIIDCIIPTSKLLYGHLLLILLQRMKMILRLQQTILGFIWRSRL